MNDVVKTLLAAALSGNWKEGVAACEARGDLPPRDDKPFSYESVMSDLRAQAEQRGRAEAETR